jgi:Protein of unknown function (DUF2568)
MRVFSLALKFFLELAAFAAFAYWGASVSIVLAIAAPALAIVLWGVFAAPRSERRLRTPARIAFETAIFILAVAALAATGALVAAIVLAVLVAISTALLTRFDQWEA